MRAYYERIEPVAEALGDLDPRIDYREVDAVAEGLDWTGFHRIEKDLWVPAQDALNADGETPAWQDWAPSTPEERAAFGDQLIADVQELYDYVHSADFQAALDDAGRRRHLATARSRCSTRSRPARSPARRTGGRAPTSGTSPPTSRARRWRSRWSATSPTSKGDDGAALVEQIDAGYADLEAALAAHGSLAEGFVNYSELTDDDKRELTDLINALAEPLSQLTVTVLE